MYRGEISEIVIYPVKSLQGISLQSSTLTEKGLNWDRHWMIVNEDGLFATQRHFNEMAKIKTEITDKYLILSHPKHSDCRIPLEVDDSSLERREVKVWKSDCKVIDEGNEVSVWLTTVLGTWREQKLSLVRMASDFIRNVSDKYTEGETNSTLFSDGYPFLITTTRSLNVLNQNLISQNEQPVPMSRFRANIIINNEICDQKVTETPEFVEHQSNYLQVDTDHSDKEPLTFKLCKPCERCKVPSIDQKTGKVVSAQQPLKTLFSMNNVEQKGAFFGENAVLTQSSKTLTETIIKIGDKITFS